MGETNRKTCWNICIYIYVCMSVGEIPPQNTHTHTTHTHTPHTHTPHHTTSRQVTSRHFTSPHLTSHYITSHHTHTHTVERFKAVRACQPTQGATKRLVGLAIHGAQRPQVETLEDLAPSGTASAFRLQTGSGPLNRRGWGLTGSQISRASRTKEAP